MPLQTVKEDEPVRINTREEWRTWLEHNHHSVQSVWIVCNTKRSGLPTVAWGDLVDEALCFGWIDSTRKTIGPGTFKQLFSKRKPKGTWSKINKEKVQRLIDSGLMTAAGMEAIRLAKENGSWTILDAVEELVIPKDLEEALKKHSGAETYFFNLSKSVRKMLLQWVALAKRPETRNKRVAEIAKQTAQQKVPGL